MLAFDQLRARIEYTHFEPMRRVAVTVSMSGFGSAGTSSRQEFVLTELDSGQGTRVDVTAEGEGRFAQWGPYARVAQALVSRRMHQRIEASA